MQYFSSLFFILAFTLSPFVHGMEPMSFGERLVQFELRLEEQSFSTPSEIIHFFDGIPEDKDLYPVISSLLVENIQSIMNLSPTIPEVHELIGLYGRIPQETFHVKIKEEMLLRNQLARWEDFIQLIDFEFTKASSKYKEEVLKLILRFFPAMVRNFAPKISQITDFWNSQGVQTIMKCGKFPFLFQDFYNTVIAYIVNYEKEFSVSQEEIYMLPIDFKHLFLDKYNSPKFLYLSFQNIDPTEVTANVLLHYLKKLKKENFSYEDIHYIKKIALSNHVSKNFSLEMNQFLVDCLEIYHSQHLEKNAFQELYRKGADQLPQESARIKKEVTFFCMICGGDYENEISYECPQESCGKKVCAPCFEESISTQIDSQNFPTHCSFCKVPLAYYSTDIKKMTRYLKGNLAYYQQKKFPNFISCSTPNCGNKIDPKSVKKNGHYDCSVCKMERCLNCTYEHVHFSNCQNFFEENKNTQLLQELLHDPKSNVRPCPYCYVPTIKSEACDHMKCTQCHNPWDWKTGKEMSPIHYSKNDGSEPRVYRVPGDKN